MCLKKNLLISRGHANHVFQLVDSICGLHECPRWTWLVFLQHLNWFSSIQKVSVQVLWKSFTWHSTANFHFKDLGRNFLFNTAHKIGISNDNVIFLLFFNSMTLSKNLRLMNQLQRNKYGKKEIYFLYNRICSKKLEKYYL